MKKRDDEIPESSDSVTAARGGAKKVAGKFQQNGSTGASTPTKEGPRMESEARKRKRTLREKFQRFMTATAFADPGEYRPPREIMYQPVKTTKVLLAVGGTVVSNDAVRYATNLCNRMDAGLDVLLVSRRSTTEAKKDLTCGTTECSEMINRRIREVRGATVPVHVSAIVGEVDKEVHTYAKAHRDVAVIVFDSGRSWQKESEREKWENVLQKLSRKLAIPTITATSKGIVGSD
jgi:hypothetical protein